MDELLLFLSGPPMDRFGLFSDKKTVDYGFIDSPPSSGQAISEVNLQVQNQGRQNHQMVEPVRREVSEFGNVNLARSIGNISSESTKIYITIRQ